jgi:hypothetical protein
MPRTVAILQSNYVPWKGYFDLIRQADEFVLYDTAQYTKNDWRNRNRIKTPQGVQWLTIPVAAGPLGRPIDAARVGDRGWAENHLTRLRYAYRDAPHFARSEPAVAALYAAAGRLDRLTDVNELFLRGLCDLLNIPAHFTRSADYNLDDPDPTGRLVGICSQAGATEYLSGPAARAYLDESRFRAAGIAVRYIDYAGYPAYPQLHGPFDHAVSALDLLFMTGPRAAEFLTRGAPAEAPCG